MANGKFDERYVAQAKALLALAPGRIISQSPVGIPQHSGNKFFWV